MRLRKQQFDNAIIWENIYVVIKNIINNIVKGGEPASGTAIGNINHSHSAYIKII